ncbi:MAG: IseA DL-endopeptidase inhibitor family protein [Saprospiraceae bacterium]|nr:IseA DL-endopeptidase inhibitor family protein [Saprospiraceae bacterium]
MRIIVYLFIIYSSMPFTLAADNGELKLRKNIQCRFELDRVPDIPKFEGMIYLRIDHRRFFVAHTNMPNLNNIKDQPEQFGHISARLRENSLAACVNFNKQTEKFYLAEIKEDILYINGADGRPIKATALDPIFIESILEAHAASNLETSYPISKNETPLQTTPYSKFALEKAGRSTKLFLYHNRKKFFIDNADLTNISHSIQDGQTDRALAVCTLFDGKYRQTAYWAKKRGDQIEIYNDSEIVKTISPNSPSIRKTKPKLLPKDISCQFAYQTTSKGQELFLLFDTQIYPICLLNRQGNLQITANAKPTTIASATFFDRTSYSRSFQAEWHEDEILVFDSELPEAHHIYIGPQRQVDSNTGTSSSYKKENKDNNWQICSIKEYGLKFEHPWKGISVFGKGPKYKLTNYLDIIVEPYCNSETRFPIFDHKIKQKRMTSIKGNVFLQGHYNDDKGPHYYYKTTHNYQCITFIFHLDQQTLTQSIAEKILATIQLN